MGSEAEEKSANNIQKQRFHTGVCILVTMIVTISCQVKLNMPNLFHPSPSDWDWGASLLEHSGEIAESKLEHSGEIAELNLTELKKCSTSFTPAEAKSKWDTKPIWIAGYPTSFDDNIHRKIVKRLTGLEQGGKSFYASKKKSLRFCSGVTETATCSVVHPMIVMKGGPGEKRDKFYGKYVVAVRNPMTAIPAFLNEKEIKYHKGVGQMKEDAWRKLRDEYLADMIEEWTNFLVSWKSESGYETGMYLVHEDLYDVEKGPAATTRLGKLLGEAGFDVVPDADVPCVWFGSIGEDRIRQKYTKHYEYDDYVPGYTEAQKSLLLTAVKSLVDRYKDDKDLALILQTYYTSIDQNTRIDREFSSNASKV